jgi:hypothetical protein
MPTATGPDSRDKGAALYMSLVARFPLRPIRSDCDLDRAAKIANALAIRDDLTLGETDYLDVLTDMIEKNEATHYPVHYDSGMGRLRFLFFVGRFHSRAPAVNQRIKRRGFSPFAMGKLSSSSICCSGCHWR